MKLQKSFEQSKYLLRCNIVILCTPNIFTRERRKRTATASVLIIDSDDIAFSCEGGFENTETASIFKNLEYLSYKRTDIDKEFTE